LADDNTRLILCPYCGNTQSEPEDRCAACGGFFDNLSLKVTQQHMGPWFVRDRHHPFRPGCSYEVLKKQIERGKVKPTTIIRGPTTRQFWSVARNVPGVAHLLGYCHGCGGHVDPDADRCSHCHTRLFAPRLRDKLGLAPAGAEMPSHGQLTGTGGDTEDTAAPSADPGATGGGGSPILAGMRGAADGNATAPNAAPRDPGAVTQATSQAQRARQAMTWMTAEGEGEPDTLATAGEPTAAVQRSTNWWTWLLIAINVGLFAVVIAAAVIIINKKQAADETDQAGMGPHVVAQPEDNDAASGPGDSNESDESRPTANDPSSPADTSEPPTNNGADDPPPGNDNADDADGNNAEADADPTIFSDDGPDSEDAIDANRWQARYQEAMELEQRGELSDALKMLKAIRANAPDDARPDGLGEAIERVEKELDRQAEELFG